jgi:uncharacterized small protein (DUF1192 family)
MDFNRLKELTKKLGGILVLNGNEPEFVIMPYENYEKMEIGENIPIASRNDENTGVVATEVVAEIDEQKTVDELNQEIAALKEEIRQKESAELLESDEETQVFADTVDLN